MGVKIEGDLNWSIDRMFAELDDSLDSVLQAGAAVIKEQARRSLIANVPAATKPNPLYNDVMADAPLYGKVNNGTVKIHVLGSGKKGSGTFRARFFEGGTKVRKQKTLNGKPLSKARVTGQIKPTRFFETAVASSEQNAYSVMEERLSQIIDNINSK